MRLRTPESLKARLDIMTRKGKVSIDHGTSAYEFHHYTYTPACIKNGFQAELDIYVRDFDGRVVYYATATENNMRDPKSDADYYREFLWCEWDKRWPTILEIRDYLAR